MAGAVENDRFVACPVTISSGGGRRRRRPTSICLRSCGVWGRRCLRRRRSSCYSCPGVRNARVTIHADGVEVLGASLVSNRLCFLRNGGGDGGRRGVGLNAPGGNVNIFGLR